MEPRLGANLTQVRLHTDRQAAVSASSIQAMAYTVGQHIVFAAGRFAPETSPGRELLAHELAHTTQQRAGAGAPPPADGRSAFESTARRAAGVIAAGHFSSVALPSSGIGLARSPDDEREKAVAEALATVARMDEDERETARKEAEEERASRDQLAEQVRPTTSLVKHHPKAQAAMVSDEQIYHSADELRANAVADAEATLLQMAEDEKATQDEEAEGEVPTALQPRQVTDEEIYASVREPEPSEPEYWARQEPGWLGSPIDIGSETRYVRKWRTETIKGAGDQGDRQVSVEDSRWRMSGAGLRGYLQYLVGDLTPFEESMTRGGVDFPEGFTVVNLGEDIGYYGVSGGSGARRHRIYSRDGSVYRDWVTEAALVGMGIGPLALALPGVGLTSMARGGVALGRGGLELGRAALQVGGRLARPWLRKAAVTTRLVIGRAEAGAANAAPTALGGFASRNTVSLIDGRSGSAVSSAVAGESSAVSVTTSATRVANAPTRVAANESAAVTPPTTVPGAPSTPAVVPTAVAVADDAIPQEIPAESSGEVTAPLSPNSGPHGEEVGEYIINGEKWLNGTTFEREILGLKLKVKPPKNSPIRTKPINDLFRLLIKEAREHGATELRITGQAIGNPNVMKLQAFIERVFGGRAIVIDGRTKAFIIPIR